MQPLRDDADGLDRRMVRLAGLLRRTRPLPSSEATKARIATALGRPQRRARRPMKLRPAAVAVALLGMVAIASAMVVRAWTRHPHEAPATSTSPREAAPTLPAAPTTTLVASPVAAPAPREHNAPVRKSRPRAPTSAASSHLDDRELAELEQGMQGSPTEAVVSPTPKPEPPPPATQSPSHEAAMLATAVRVLRGDHDPKRAQAMLESYLRRYPHGLLVEEALAMAVEAAAAHDDRKALTLAADYLRRYPAGRFRSVAESAMQRFGR
jgi:hypothetical protein